MERNKLYPLEEVITITILAVIALAQGWEDIERYARAKKEWLGRFLKLEHGIPPHDVYRRVMCRLKPEEVERCFMDWVREIRKKHEREVVAIDGKTVRTRIRTDRGPENMATVRKIALTVARSDTEAKGSIIGRRKQMAWSYEYRERLLFHSGLASPP